MSTGKPIEQMNSQDLKAAYYDQLLQIEKQEGILKLMKENLNVINQNIAKKLQDESKPVEAPKNMGKVSGHKKVPLKSQNAAAHA